ncbi:hypothetical protein J5N97_028834 [Dioscorea zingiberensis]|uniref:PGG domain-containing protein n=1 Tax=Dioscorea zingiberensis TaxID=325984 RepID=A0A9D5BZ87_9LILI|nr:hypothetical protein J5N97_028834 [Dioscorea zingiberensis]
MDQRLEEACHSGDLDILHSLLREDKLLLHRLSITASIDNPLHIAALLGHTELAEELITRKPDLASELNPGGLSPLHLASAHGHLSIVKHLISKVGSHLCLLKDKDGRLPFHTAAVKGRIGILEELINARPESAQALTYQKESVLHLAVQFNSFETLEYLVEKLGVGGEIKDELLNVKDDKGNTILHHAVARRQLQTVKLLVYKTRMEVNTRNLKGLTPLDLLLELPSEHGDLALGKVIRAAGGKTTEDHEEQQQTPPHANSSPIDDFMAPPKAASLSKRSKKRSKIEDTYTPGTLIVVATLIATITFQAGLSPPGGFTQPVDSDRNSSSTPSPAGMPVFGSKLNLFLVFDVIGLFTSLTIILLIICLMPKKRKRMMMILVWIIWVSVFSTGLAFTAAFSDIYKDSEYLSVLLVRGWTWVFRVFILLLCFKFCRHLLRMVGWCHKEGDQEESDDVKRMGVLLFFGRVVVLMVILMFVVVVAIVNIVVFVVWDLGISLGDLYLKIKGHQV